MPLRWPGARRAPATIASLAAAAALSGCGDRSIVVTVHIDPVARVECVKVAAWSVAGREQLTAPILRQGRDLVSVALFPGGELEDLLFVDARGFEDPGCQTPSDQTAPVAARFSEGRPVVLRLLGPAFPYVPSNFEPRAVPRASIAPPILIDCAARFDTGTGTSSQWCGRPPPPMAVLPQAGGPEVGLIATYGLTITGGGLLELVGTRPAIVAVFGDATLDGVVTVRSLRDSTTAAGANPGPPWCALAGSASADPFAGGGGGGGGFGTAGGTGGNATGGGTFGAPGGAAAGTPQLIPLRGGCPGGRGGQASGLPGAGGAGGGAFQLSVSGQLTVSNSITASGAGADGGQQDQGGSNGGGNGGGGGGSGGALLLEGARVTVASPARLTANGGGGGQGGSWTTDPAYTGYPGSNGSTLTDQPASGGNGPSCGGQGGNGGSRNASPQTGRDSQNTSGCGGGGGGGAVGRIRVNGAAQCAVGAGVLSPVPSYGGQCP